MQGSAGAARNSETNYAHPSFKANGGTVNYQSLGPEEFKMIRWFKARLIKAGRCVLIETRDINSVDRFCLCTSLPKSALDRLNKIPQQKTRRFLCHVLLVCKLQVTVQVAFGLPPHWDLTLLLLMHLEVTPSLSLVPSRATLSGPSGPSENLGFLARELWEWHGGFGRACNGRAQTFRPPHTRV